MALTKDIKRPDDTALLEMVQEGMAPSEIAKIIPYSANTVRGWLRDMGCTHDGKGRWFLSGIARETTKKSKPIEPKQSTPTGRSVLQEQFPFIRTRTTILADGSRLTLPDLSTLIAARTEQNRREKHL